jgi:hypothetical protein
MLLSRFQVIERQIRALGWTYDVDNGEFHDGKRLIGWQELFALLPIMKLDELAGYLDDRYDLWRKSRA